MPTPTRRHLLNTSLALVGFGLLTGCGDLPARTKQHVTIPLIGFLSSGLAGPELFESFRDGMRALGYIEGHNLIIERRDADGQLERIPNLASQLVALNPAVIVATFSEAVRAVQQASSSIAIVFPALQDPVENGLVASLARPGGTVTGLGITAGGEAAKRLELLQQSVPGLSRVAIVWDRGSAHRERETVGAAQTMGVEYRSCELQDVGDLDAVLASATAEGCDSLIMMGSFQFNALAPQIVAFAAQRRLPAMYSITSSAQRGGLLAYAPSILENFRRAATYVDKILKGAKPADLPIELPAVFDFIINLKTAHALGLTVPPYVLAQATEVIQ